MKRKFKRIITLLLTLCMLAGLGVSLQTPAEATDVVEEFNGIAIEKVLTTISKTPVLLMPVVEIIPNTSTTGCFVSNMSWTDSTGAAVGESFQDAASNTVTLRVDAAQGYFFAENVVAYLNNNQCDVVRDPSGSFITFSRSYVPDVWAPSIAKHPGAETVELGGWASFVATATYCNKYEWSLVSPDGSTTVKIADVPSKFPGVATDPDGSTKMNIYNIPAEMDGWKIRCTFSSPGGSAVSNGAKITVKGLPEPTPEPAPTPTPEPTAAPETESGDNGDADATHQHEYPTQFEYDADYHWKQCECGEIDAKEAHDMQWTETVAPTKRADGEEQGRCTVCGYTDSRTLSYSDSKADDDTDGGKLIKIILAVLIGLVVLTVILLIVDKVQRERRRRRRRRRRRY